MTLQDVIAILKELSQDSTLLAYRTDTHSVTAHGKIVVVQIEVYVPNEVVRGEITHIEIES